MSNLKKKIPTGTSIKGAVKSSSSQNVKPKSSSSTQEKASVPKAQSMVNLGDLARAKLYTYQLKPEQQTGKITGIASIIQRLIATPFLALSEMGSSAAEVTFDFEENKYAVQSADDCGPVFDDALSEKDVTVLKTLTPSMCENLGLFLTSIWKAKVAVQRVSEAEFSDSEEMQDEVDEVEEGEGEGEAAEGSDEEGEDIEFSEESDDGFNINDGIVMAINLF
uniref:Uncharacterized protein n=1 Tax=Clandestinovirus TaxID=2831644 RepID=A0A8F8KQ36_9VIRU|nr:hypothetical protein KOM_12_462 [Clandestinovirus]